MCGGTSGSTRFAMVCSGLSPRVRGNRRRYNLGCRCLGSIPACAGEPSKRGTSTAAPSVYPRVCGGTQRSPVWWFSLSGLSPRVRGNRKDKSDSQRRRRSIPACAGEPSYPLPRHVSNAGLSPRVRGNPIKWHTDAVDTGSIPACAGEPRPIRARSRDSTVYPRVCGGTR